MGIFRRRAKPASAGPNKGAAAQPPPPEARTVHERIEVTVEREWVSMVVRNPPVASPIEGAAAAGAAPADEARLDRLLEPPDPELPTGD